MSTLYIVFAAAGLLLLIACVNVANLIAGPGNLAEKGVFSSRGTIGTETNYALFVGELSCCIPA